MSLLVAKLFNIVANWLRKTPLAHVIRKLLLKKANPFTHSSQYWETRYQQQGNSGAGSYNNLALFKAEIVNAFIKQHNMSSVIESGCGDGNQLTLAEYEEYIGFDISHTVINHCRTKFQNDHSKQFIHLSEYSTQTADLTLSLDVIYHLVEDDVFEEYMRLLFTAASEFVITYSSNETNYPGAAHVKHRRFTDWIESELATSWQQIKTIKNKYPYDPENTKQTSVADFFVFQKVD
jgi:protein O-GlcNAc transferase